jgi:hypothetical protein
VGIPLNNPNHVFNAVKGDFDNDQRDDLALAFTVPNIPSEGGFVLLLTASQQVRVNGVNPPGGLAAGDFNGDGNLDLLVAGGNAVEASSLVTVAYGDGQGNFTLTPVTLGSGGQGAAAVGDIDGDGDLDGVSGNIVTGPGGNTVVFYYYLQDGSGQLASPGKSAILLPPPGTMADTVPSVYLADVNGDLRPDVVAVQENQFIVVYLNRGSAPNFYPQVPDAMFSFTGEMPSNLALGDFNGDGLLDLLVPDNSLKAAAVFLNASIQNQAGISVTLTPNQRLTGVNFTNGQLGQISGQVYEDLNRNGQKETGEAGLAGQVVFVDLNRNGRLDPREPTATTRAGGHYTFSGLPDGSYAVGVAPEADSISTDPGAEFIEVVVNGGLTLAHADFARARRLIQPHADIRLDQGQPLATPVPLTTAVQGHNLRYTLEAGSFAGLQVDRATGIASWKPGPRPGPGKYVAAVRVRDAFEPAFTETVQFAITVDAVPASVLYVEALYRTLLHRDPEAAGLADWVNQLDAGVTRLQVAQGIWESREHRGLQVDEYYTSYLHRTSDTAGRAFWVSTLLGGVSEEAVQRGFLTSDEYRWAHPSTTAYLTELYADVLGRKLDPNGLAMWQQAAQNGASPAAIADGFLYSAEKDRQRVDSYYADYLGRAGEPAGVNSWLSQIQSGQQSPARIAEAFLASDEFFTRAAAGLVW